jgi:hypothetical protein
MSCNTPPAAIVVGWMPVKVIGFVEAFTRVIAATAKCTVSVGDHAITVTLVAAVAPELLVVTGKVLVGTVAGAVKVATVPEVVIEPQEGLHVLPLGLATPQVVVPVTGGKSSQICVLEPATGCITAHITVVGGVFSSEAVNATDAAGLSPTGTVGDVGLTDARMPESSVTTAVPVFFLLALAVAVKVIVGIGFGKLASVGAVYVSTLFAESGVLDHVPMFPVPPCILSPLLQFLTVTEVGLGFEVVAAGVYAYEQVHTEVCVLEPLTDDVNVCTVPAITLAVGGDTESVTVFGPEPPHPFCNINAAANTNIAAVSAIRPFMPDISLIVLRVINRVPLPLQSPIARPNSVVQSDGLNHLARCP